MIKSKSSKILLALRLCFLLMAFVFLSNNFVQPLYDYFDVESTELIKDADEEKSEKEKEGPDTDEYFSDLTQYFSYSTVLESRKTQNNRDICRNYLDISTPPPERT